MGWFSGYPWLWWRCRWFPWLPRWWWTGIYGPIAPYVSLPKEQEIALLENQKKLMEEALKEIKKKLEELRKEEMPQ